jgi:hypothetical protein
MLLFATKQWIFGLFLLIASGVCAVLGFTSSRMREKVYSKGDIFVQWIILVLPTGSVALMALLLARFVFPIAGYLAAYALVLLAIAAMAARELRRGVPVEQG